MIPSTKRKLPPVFTDASEFAEQCALTQWVDTLTPQVPALLMYFHVPNGAAFRHSRNKRTGESFSNEALRMKRAGLRAGVADVILDEPVGRFHGLRIELKRRDGGRASPEQLDWIDRWQRRNYRAEVCRGWVDAASVIVDYLVPAIPIGQRLALLDSLRGLR